jgi:hypothetical protein
VTAWPARITIGAQRAGGKNARQEAGIAGRRPALRGGAAPNAMGIRRWVRHRSGVKPFGLSGSSLTVRRRDHAGVFERLFPVLNLVRVWLAECGLTRVELPSGAFGSPPPGKLQTRAGSPSVDAAFIHGSSVGAGTSTGSASAAPVVSLRDRRRRAVPYPSKLEGEGAIK